MARRAAVLAANLANQANQANQENQAQTQFSSSAVSMPASTLPLEPLPLYVMSVVGKLNERRSTLSSLICGCATQPSPSLEGSLHWAAICLASVAHVSGTFTSFVLTGHPLPSSSTALLPSADLRSSVLWGSMLRYVVRLLQVWAPSQAIILACDSFARNNQKGPLGRQLLLEALVVRIKEMCSHCEPLSLTGSRSSLGPTHVGLHLLTLQRPLRFPIIWLCLACSAEYFRPSSSQVSE